MTILIYYVLLEALNAVRQQAQLEERAAQQDTLLAMQYTQYQQLSRHIEEVREARPRPAPALKSHRALPAEWENGGSESLYRTIPHDASADTARTWCENYAVNTVISYYGEEARKASVDFSVRIQLPPSLPLREPELCSIFGNLLENALDACRECTDSAPFIRICAQEDASHIVIAVDNTCCHPPIEENGRFRSTKHDGLGTGTASIRSIAERYQGVADFRYEDGIFYASVMLKFDSKISHGNP